jgi:hypothetical protein
MVNRMRMCLAPRTERVQLALVSLDSCDTILRIYEQEGLLSIEETASLLSVRDEALDLLREAGYLTR